MAQALKIKYFLHSAWHPRSSGKEKANHTLKRHLAKLSLETQENWVTLLPIGLLRMRIASKQPVGLSSFESLSGKPFLTVDL